MFHATSADPFWELPQFWTAVLALVVVLGVIAVVVILQRKPRGSVAMEAGDIKVKVDWDSEETKKKAEAISTPEVELAVARRDRSQFRWDSYSSLFWLGNDLMWTKAAVRAGWPPSRIVGGIKDCLGHMQRLGLSGTWAGKEMERLREFVGKQNQQYALGESGFTDEKRKDLYVRLEAVKNFVADLSRLDEAKQVAP